VPAWPVIRRLFIRHFALGHFGAAIGRLPHRDHVRLGHFRAEKGNETDYQQSTQAGFAHELEFNLALIQSKPQLFDLNGLG